MEHQRLDSIANEFAEFVRLESNWAEYGRGPVSIRPRQHALEQLVESNMGPEITASAHGIVDSTDKSFETAVVRDLSGSSSFQLLRGAVQNFHETPSEYNGGDENETNKKTKISEQSKAGPLSFSLFDMLDRQKEDFVLPPRIAATTVIEAHQRKAQETPDFRNDHRKINEYEQYESALELLEKADDIEDLSPDHQTWELIRQILYGGLNSSSLEDKSSLREQSRFLKVHESLQDICRRGTGGSSNKSQCWDLAQNLVGCILSFSEDFLKKLDQLEKDVRFLREYLDFYWDTVKCLVTSLSNLALDYITSCVGDEKEIERIMLGICLMLTHHVAACTTASMEPLAGWFEVWARFISPRRMLTIVQCSGLGGVVLRRCYQRGRCATAKCLVHALNISSMNCKYTSMDDVVQAVFLQSLSILRVILYSCGSSASVVSTIFHQFMIADKSPNDEMKQDSILSWFTANEVACVDNVHELLNQTECDNDIVSKQATVEITTAIEVTSKVFHDTLASDQYRTIPCVKWICESSLEIFSGFQNVVQLP